MSFSIQLIFVFNIFCLSNEKSRVLQYFQRWVFPDEIKIIYESNQKFFWKKLHNDKNCQEHLYCCLIYFIGYIASALRKYHGVFRKMVMGDQGYQEIFLKSPEHPEALLIRFHFFHKSVFLFFSFFQSHLQQKPLKLGYLPFFLVLFLVT